MTQNHYRVLQVDVSAQKSEITTAYRRLSKLYHPDINHHPDAEARMKMINTAYHTLRDDMRRREYDRQLNLRPAPVWGARAGAQASTGQTPGEEAYTRAEPALRDDALRTMTAYMDHLLTGEYERAYQYLCLHDKQYVTLQSFCKWRHSVHKLFAIRNFTAKASDELETLTHGDEFTAKAIKIYVNVTERNHAAQTLDKYQFTKYTVQENGLWRIFLGYRDLNEIARMFEDLSHRHEQGEMARRWDEYCSRTCRGLDMLSREGLLKEGERELYRCKRYSQELTIAVVRMAQVGTAGVTDESLSDIVECCALTLYKTLRETDVPAYLGNGVFAVLFIELKKKHARAVVARTVDRMSQGVLQGTGMIMSPRFSFEQYETGPLADYLTRLSSATL